MQYNINTKKFYLFLLNILILNAAYGLCKGL